MGSQLHSPKPPASPKPQPKSLERIMSMNGGDGESSYNRMSVVQAYALHGLQPSLAEAVTQMAMPQPRGAGGSGGPLRIADFGSATGRNAFMYMDFLVACVRREHQRRGAPMPEVQTFFNDLPGNDFNTLFNLLPPMKNEGAAADLSCGGGGGEQVAACREYFAAGVPGSFYGRLFPSESLHFAVSLHCLHWISQIPAVVADPESELYNRGSCWIMGGEPSIARAFAQQSQDDFRKFLRCRATELAPGGILYCYLSGRADLADPTNQTIPERRHRYLAGPDFEGSWDDLIAEGIITEETRDSFNLPIYCPHVEEVRAAIAHAGGFEIIRLERLEDLALCPEETRMELLRNPKQCAKFYSSWVRALVEPLMAAHMGGERTDEWFVRHQRRVAARCRAMLGDSEAQEAYKFLSADFLLIVLKKK